MQGPNIFVNRPSCLSFPQPREARFTRHLQQAAGCCPQHQPQPGGAGFAQQRPGKPGGEAAMSGTQSPQLQTAEPEVSPGWSVSFWGPYCSISRGSIRNSIGRNFPGGPVVKTSSFYCQGHGFKPWLGS